MSHIHGHLMWWKMLEGTDWFSLLLTWSSFFGILPCNKSELGSQLNEIRDNIMITSQTHSSPCKQTAYRDKLLLYFQEIMFRTSYSGQLYVGIKWRNNKLRLWTHWEKHWNDTDNSIMHISLITNHGWRLYWSLVSNCMTWVISKDYLNKYCREIKKLAFK